MLFGQLGHDPRMPLGYSLRGEVPEEDILLFPVVRPICIHADEIGGGIDEDNNDCILLPELGDLPVKHPYRPFNGAVLPHQRPYRFHGNSLNRRITWSPIINLPMLFLVRDGALSMCVHVHG